MADKFHSLPIPKYIARLFPLALKGAANGIGEDFYFHLAIGDGLARLSSTLRPIFKARYFASGIGKIVARREIAVS